MKTVISMKIINCNNWAPRNALNIPIPITDPPVDLQGLLGKFYFTWDHTLIISTGGFYYRLCIHMADKYIWGLYP